MEFKNLDKVIFPETGITKGELLDYYRAVAPFLLPELKDRPVTLERMPDGARGNHFWQKNIPAHYPSWIPRVPLPTQKGKLVRYGLINGLDTLLYLVNQGAVAFHVFASRVPTLSLPDYVVFDLDPSPDNSCQDVAEVARALHMILAEREILSTVKTSGKSGLHVVAPWNPEGGGYDEARAWSMHVARDAAVELPRLATVERLKTRRKGRVYIDVIQNALGHHIVPAYVVRPTPEARVSTPLDWSELGPGLDARNYTIRTVLSRLSEPDAGSWCAA